MELVYFEKCSAYLAARRSEMKKNPWFVYMLRCSDGSLYTGITKNVLERLKAHNAGNGAKYTRGRKPVTLLFQEKHPHLSSARRREEEIKKLERRNKEKLF